MLGWESVRGEKKGKEEEETHFLSAAFFSKLSSQDALAKALVEKTYFTPS